MISLCFIMIWYREWKVIYWHWYCGRKWVYLRGYDSAILWGDYGLSLLFSDMMFDTNFKTIQHHFIFCTSFVALCDANSISFNFGRPNLGTPKQKWVVLLTVDFLDPLSNLKYATKRCIKFENWSCNLWNISKKSCQEHRTYTQVRKKVGLVNG